MQPNAPYAPPPQAPVPTAPGSNSQSSSQGPGYDFIMSPAKPPRRSLFPGGTTPIVRVAIVLVALLVILILFVIIKSLFTHSNTGALTTVAQEQQAIIHLSTAAGQSQNTQQTPLADSTKNFAITAQLSMTSAQRDLLAYMQKNGKKVKTKTLNLKVSKNVDDQLKTAATNANYDQTFRQTMRTQLNEYEQSLRIAYSQTKGTKGRALLNSEFKGAELLKEQLNQP